VAGRELPQYGYLVVGPELTSTIERRDGIICESSRAPGVYYCNGRAFDLTGAVPITPQVENFEYLGERQFAWDVVWDAGQPTRRDLTVFVHFYREEAARSDRIAFQDDHRADPPPTQWQGEVRYRRTVTVPEDAEGDYFAAFGLYDSEGRLALRGRTEPLSGGGAIAVGRLTVKREAGEITGITLDTSNAGPVPEEEARGNPEGRPVDFGFAVTAGACRIEVREQTVLVTPLPDLPPFELALRLSELGLSASAVQRALSRQADGSTAELTVDMDQGLLKLRHDGRSFQYELQF
jgi:hypothetical protein